MLAQKGKLKATPMPSPENRRRSQRRVLNRPAKIYFGPGNMQRDCIVTDISDGGVRLRIEGFNVPDEFVLLVAEDGYSYKERAYQVVWRHGPEAWRKIPRPDQTQYKPCGNSRKARAQVAIGSQSRWHSWRVCSKAWGLDWLKPCCRC